MPYGFEFYDGSGNLTLSSDFRLFKHLGSLTIAYNATGSITVPEFANSLNAPFWYVLPPIGAANTNYCPNITISGTTLSYSPSSTPYQGSAINVTLYYGYF